MSDLPWRVVSSPLAQWREMPSFVVGEVLFITCALLALAHALGHEGVARRRHLAVWIGALVTGTVNDWIFMLLPLVDNFWQAQATVMLSPRMPLYIPCVYVWFMYLPTVTLWRVRSSRLGRAAASGLAAIVVYAPYDIVGAKFLWWTWHDTDQPIAHRLLGAPMSSSLWVITFVACFSFILSRMLDHEEDTSAKTAAIAVVVTALTTTVAMMLQMTVLQQLDGGTPGPRALVTAVIVYAALFAHGRWRAAKKLAPADDGARDPLLRGAAFAYFGTLAAIMLVFAPETHRSTGVHQTVGECYVEAKDITGLTRYEFLCARDFDEDYTFDCAPPPPDGSRWYTICGRPHRAPTLHRAGVAGLGVLGLLLYGGLLASRRLRSRPDGDSG